MDVENYSETYLTHTQIKRRRAISKPGRIQYDFC
jgi:hypothetical protein